MIIHVLQFELAKQLAFLDERSRAEYMKLRQLLSSSNLRPDEDFQITEVQAAFSPCERVALFYWSTDVLLLQVIELENYKPYISVYEDHDSKLEFFRLRWYCLFTCCLLTWPYRCFFSFFTRPRKLTVLKVVGL